jgi:hypothetical protein
MANIYKERELGQSAEQWLKSEAWQEAWTAYRTRIMEEVERAPNNKDGDEFKLRLLRMLSVATGVRGHLELLMKNGAVSAKAIEMEDKRSLLRRVIG